ncbi:MAG: CCA tRNA nucleotidyltransferase [Robiginitomaculum sp.]
MTHSATTLPAATLPESAQSWLTDAGTLSVMAALGRDKARFVGGAVRDSLMGNPVSDIDIATQLEPDAVMAALKSAGIKAIPTGLAHGTITAVVDGSPIEITTLRRDVETDGRRAVVAFTLDWAEDAERRDFTMNALYADCEGNVYDPTGCGLDDLAARRFVFVGDADMRVAEDHLRIMRYFRFLAWHGGDAKLDADALRACREGRGGLAKLSAERVWGELKKLLKAPNPTRILQIMLTNEILEKIVPEASNVDGLSHFIALEREHGLVIDPLRRIMAMSARNPLPMALLCKRMKVSQAEKSRLRGWTQDDTVFEAGLSEREAKIAIYKAGNGRAADRCLIRAAGESDPILRAKWMALVTLSQNWMPPRFPLTGKDMLEQGIKPGPAMGKKLAALEALWVRSAFTTGKEQLLMALKLLGR